MIDYDLTMSAGDATECHKLFTFPDMPAAFLKDIGHLWTVAADLHHADRLEVYGPEDGIQTPHAFWTRFNCHLVQHGITRSLVDQAVETEKRKRGSLLRPGVQELLSFCETHDILVVVLSAGFTNIIHKAFQLDGIVLPASCVVLANTLIYDVEGRVLEVTPSNPPSSRKGKLQYLGQVACLADRPCALLVGDKAIDASMALGYPPLVGRGAPAQLKIGFSNAALASEEERAEFESAFDIVPRNGLECSFAPVTGLLRALVVGTPGIVSEGVN